MRLADRVKQLEAEIDGHISRRKAAECDMRSAIEREKETRAQFDALKSLLATAEAENQRMRGYIQRVQEDDVVREDLVTVGDPEGEQHFVPKRKPTPFQAPSAYPLLDTAEGGASVGSYRERVRPKHWVAY